MTRLPAALLSLCVAAIGCATTSPGVDESAQIAAVLRAAAAHEALLGDTEARAHHLTAAWQDVTESYDRASARYAQAKRQFEAAQATAAEAGAGFEAARAEFEYATKLWKFYEQLVVVAATIDAANLDAARASGVARGVECQPMSTQRYRRVLEKRGVDLTGKDIDHIVPRSLGGADDVSNYEVLPSSQNRSIGALWGQEKCEIAGMPACAVAVAISRRCGSFAGPMPW